MRKDEEDSPVTLTRKELRGITLTLEHLLNITQDDNRLGGSFERIRALETIKKLKIKVS